MSINGDSGDPNNNYDDQQNTDQTSVSAGVTPDSSPQKVLNDTRQERQQQSPLSSGQQSSISSGQSGTGGYSQPESGYGQPPAGSTEPQGGDNDTYSQGDPRQRQDGYGDTQGSGPGQTQADPGQMQEGYDPAKSGVRHAQNTPGTPVDVPGRETGSAWGEDQQMGYTTDTPDRKNPAN